jgi:hypothetical protein
MVVIKPLDRSCIVTWQAIGPNLEIQPVLALAPHPKETGPGRDDDIFGSARDEIADIEHDVVFNGVNELPTISAPPYATGR